MEVEFTRYRTVPAEGARIGLMSCLGCGAAILLDPGDTVDMAGLHVAWHEANDRAEVVE